MVTLYIGETICFLGVTKVFASQHGASHTYSNYYFQNNVVMKDIVISLKFGHGVSFSSYFVIVKLFVVFVQGTEKTIELKLE